MLKEFKDGFAIIAEAYIKACGFFEHYSKDIALFVEALEMLPELERRAGDKWISYNWVPLLPESTLESYVTAFDAPDNQTEADNFMLRNMETEFASIQNYLFEQIIENESKTELLRNAVTCYEKGLYTGCALCVFALIDYFFLIKQKKHEKQRRELPRKATGVLISEEEKKECFCAYITVGIIQHMYQDTKDFTIIEKPLHRNYLSHGMNNLLPGKTECFKLFVLLYNICLLFENDIFHNINDGEN